MSDFVIKPNLPQCADIVIFGEKYSSKLSKSMNKLGLNPILVPNNPLLGKELSGHADLSVLHGGGEGIFLAPYLKNSEFLASLHSLGAEIFFPDMIQNSKYPYDAGLNLCICGENVIFNPKTASPPIVNILTIEKSYKPILCKQGYSRCSVCVVDEKSIITSDRGIAAAAAEHGLSVLEITEGYISLLGFKYGFVGGASFKVADDIIVFTGVLDGHPDKSRILEFLSQRSIKPVFLTDEPIFDIGGVIPLSEKKPL